MNREIKCMKCNGPPTWLMTERRTGSNQYYCKECNWITAVLPGQEPVIAFSSNHSIHDAIYQIASKIPKNIYEENNIDQDTFLELLIEQRRL